MEHAYNPYSGFSVGAALLSQDGKTITAANLYKAAAYQYARSVSPRKG